LLVRVQDGDRQAQDQLAERIAARMEVLGRKMLNRDERPPDFEEARGRLLQSLEALRPANMRDFCALAAELVRRELLDLAREHDARRRAGGDPTLPSAALDTTAGTLEIADTSAAVDEMARWINFHDAFPRLPIEERETFGLIFYHGWMQGDVAELLQCDERTVRRCWHRACLALKEMLGDEMPTFM
jgi:RNA polymerase sigma-70 factor (ECF subfamily)